MQIFQEEREGCLVVTVKERRLDHAVAAVFRDRVMDWATRGRPLVIDLSEVEFMDSSGLGAIVGVRKRLGWSVRIVLAGLKSPVFRVFELAKVTTVFSFYTSVDAAMSRAGGDGAHWEKSAS